MRLLRHSGYSIILILILLASSGCAGYNKILKDPNPEKRYQAALKYFEAKKYSRSTPLFETLDLAFNGYPQEDTAKFYTAKGYYLMSDYHSAEIGLEQFTRMFGRSPFAEEAYFLRSVNLYKMAARPELDQTSTVDAITAYKLFKSKFPDSEYGKEKNYLDELVGRLEYKSYISAKLYYQIEDYKSAIIALRNSVKEFPDSKYSEEVSFLVLKSSYIYAKRSVKRKQPERYIAAIDEYYNFISEYPESKYKEEAQVMYNEAIAYTKKRGINAGDEINR